MSSAPPPYILQELPDITETVNYPIKDAHRIKYTCFDVSKNFIAFGATSGGIYVFNRWPCEFVQLVPSKDGPITRLAISSDEMHIGFANGKGVVTVTECNQCIGGGYSSTASKEHNGNEVTTMVWSRNMLFTGDDVGRVAVLQLQSFMAKTMFHSSSQVIMSLDSRICQLDVRDSMLLVSTLTRCFICNTAQEQYRQIGQKLRDGEFGACFVNHENSLANGITQNDPQNFAEVKKYNIVDDDAGFCVGEGLANSLIYCARPSSRLWEATIDGTVRRTHQFKQVLAKQPMKAVSVESYNNQNFSLQRENSDNVGQSLNFSKIYDINSAIFSYNKNSLYFLNIQNVDHTIWFDQFKDIVECKIYYDILYVWLANNTLVNLRFMKIDKFLIKCFVDEKYLLCAELCALFKDYLLSSNLSLRLNVLAGLRDKLQNNGLLSSIDSVLDKFDALKTFEATQMKSGIYVVDNTYQTQTLLDEHLETKQEDHALLTPETLQALKGLSVTVSDKLNSSKKRLIEKWEGFEEKMKQLGEKQAQDNIIQDGDRIPRWIPREESSLGEETVDSNEDIIFKESSQKTIEIDNNSLEKDKICKSLYQYSRLSLVSKESEISNLTCIIESYACDIREIYELMSTLEQYCITIGAPEDSSFVPNNIFLSYLDASPKKCELLDYIIKDEVLYKYFVDSCISVNIKTQTLSNLGCECGFPLPYIRTSQLPVFSELIDEFIERQWSGQTREQCYEICKKMPYLWRKILYLRRNEDLLHVLRILLQMLDENLLHSFLPQFTLDSWERAIQLYAILHANICLNCNKKFEHISVRDTLSWDDLGSLLIKSVGGRTAIQLLQKHANLIETGALTIKFYHTCLMVTLYEKYDATTLIPLVDTIYSSYEYGDARSEICHLLCNASDGEIKHTALPVIVAARSSHWGLDSVCAKQTDASNLHDVLNTMAELNGSLDCVLCGLPLQNEVLIKDGGLWSFRCGHTFHGACLDLNKLKLCPSCSVR